VCGPVTARNTINSSGRKQEAITTGAVRNPRSGESKTAVAGERNLPKDRVEQRKR